MVQYNRTILGVKTVEYKNANKSMLFKKKKKKFNPK